LREGHGANDMAAVRHRHQLGRPHTIYQALYLTAWGWRIDSGLSGRVLVGLAGLFKIMAT
jgi:hypothetical protein